MRNWVKRSGHATVVAYLALFLALGGGAMAIAGGVKINGSKLKKRSVAGSKLKKHTVTGTEVNLDKLGKVPTAAAADTAGTAGTAKVANSLSTMTPLMLTRTTASAAGPTEEVAAAAATSVTLYEDGHFKVYGKCFVVEPEVLRGVIYIATSQNGAIYDGQEDELAGDEPEGLLDTDTPEEFREIQNISAAKNSANVFEADPFGATAADGYTIFGETQDAVKSGALADGEGPYGPGESCLFAGYVLHS